jgi:hypothetical protein
MDLNWIQWALPGFFLFVVAGHILKGLHEIKSGETHRYRHRQTHDGYIERSRANPVIPFGYLGKVKGERARQQGMFRVMGASTLLMGIASLIIALATNSFGTLLFIGLGLLVLSFIIHMLGFYKTRLV